MRSKPWVHRERRDKSDSLTSPLRSLFALAISFLVCLVSGCQVVTNPVANGIPVRLLNEDLLAKDKTNTEPIPLEWLMQPIPQDYVLAPGDILGIYIDGILGGVEDLPPVQVLGGDDFPAIGSPIAIREDGTIPLPLIDPIQVEGLTVPEVETRIAEAYTRDEGILKSEKTRILVSLLQRRTIQVHVIRQDSAGNGEQLDLLRSPLSRSGLDYPQRQHDSRGTAVVLDLPAFENDLLNALTRTGGLPGLDALNEVEIHRGLKHDLDNPQVTLIPLRVPPGSSKPFETKDVVLQSGDIVFIGRRDSDFYYTAGLLGNRKVNLPRDYNIRALEAVIETGGPLVNGSLSTNNLSGAIANSGIGTPNPSLLSIVRRVADGRQVVIKVDLNRALVDARENIAIQKDDILVLQETTDEAFARYLSSTFRFSIFGRIFERSDAAASVSGFLP